MTALILILLCVGLIWALMMWMLGWDPSGSGSNQGTDFDQWRIDQAKQDALDDIRRRRERAEDQLRRLGRWSR